MPVPPILRGAAAAGLLLALAGCLRPAAAPTRLTAVPATPPAPAERSYSATLAEAARSLDTLYVPAPGAEEAVLSALRDLRHGRMEAALQRLLPVAGGADAAAAPARDAVGQLLLHFGRWDALAGASEAAGPLFAAFARAAPERWEYPEAPVMLPLDLTPVGTPVVEVLVNGHARRFWIDTGAGLTVLSSTLAAEVGIRAGEGAGRAGTGTSRSVAARPAVIDELRLGAITVRNHPAIVLDAGDLALRVPGTLARLRIDGILGWPLLARLDLTLDHVGRRVVLREPHPRPTAERNLFWLGYPVVAARAENGRELLLGLDTGASASSLSARFLSAAGVEATGTRARRVGSAGGYERVTVQTLREATLLVDGWRVHLTGVDVAAEHVGGALDLHGVVGSDLVGLGAVRIDFLNGRFDFLPASGGR
jgi:hypothetical protein